MNSESKEEKEQLEKETINLNEFFNLIINQAQTNKILQNFKDNIMEFYSINIDHYNRINKLLKKINSEKFGQKNINNTFLLKLQSMIEQTTKIQLKSMEIFIAKKEQFLSFEDKILQLQKLIEKFSSKFKNNNYNINIYKDANSLLENLMNKMDELETKVIDEYIQKKYNKNISDTSDQKPEQIVSEIKFLEKTFFDYLKERKKQYFKNLKKSNNKIQNAFEEIKKTFEEYYNGLKEINKILNDESKNFENILNSNFKSEEINENQNFIFSLSDINLINNTIQYKIKILKSPKISIGKQETFSKSKTLDLKDFELDNVLSKQKTIVNSKNGKIYNDDILYLNEKDLYEIISKLYSYNLKILDKSNYNLDLEKEKLIAMDLSKEVLSYNESNEDIQKKFEEKYDEIIESINNKILNKIENLKVFFISFNNYRASGKISLFEKFYELIVYIYKKTLDKLMETSNKKIEGLLLILSQTYYKEINGNKIYILEEIKSHELFKRDEFWKSFIVNKIEEEIKMKRNMESKNNYNILLTQEKKEDIILTKLLPFSELLKEYDVSKNKIFDLVNQIFDKYNCNEKTKERVFSFINTN